MKKAMPGVFRLAGFNFGLMYIGKNKKKIKTNFTPK